MAATDLPTATADAQRIAAACKSFEVATKSALNWIADEKNADRVRLERPVLEEDLRRCAFKVRKLGKIVQRPMCVGVFGPSQAGKSYLIGVLARKGEKLTALFDEGRTEIDFLEKINPDGKKESTGLVTRFTIKPIKTPPGYPVALRLFDQTDIVKILVNSYVNDTARSYDPALTPDDVLAHLSTFESLARPSYVDVLVEEDIWDLQDYVRHHCRDIAPPFEAYWERIARLAPRVSVAARGELFSILWGKHEPLTSTYQQIVECMGRLSYAENVYCQLDSLIPKFDSIIDVEALNALGGNDTSHLNIVTADGKSASLPRSILAAITAELCIVIPDKPYDFFEHTDLLDFPGYRARENIHLAAKLASAREVTIKDMFLRGKVDYLFQRYTADQELNTLLLCIPPGPLEAKSLIPAMEEWVSMTHGRTPNDRLGRVTSLFFCLTKFDDNFAETAGDSNPASRFHARMQASLLKDFGKDPLSWPVAWTPNQSFRNCYWIRNPKYKSLGTIEYDSVDAYREVQIVEQRLPFLNSLHHAHNDTAEIQAHFHDPDIAWNEVMKLNDGGITHLAEGLSKVCLPGVKTSQIRVNLLKLRNDITERLQRYYVSTDMQKRLDERLAVYEDIFNDIEASLERSRFGSLIAGLCIDRIALGDALREAITSSDFDSSGSRAGDLTKPSGSSLRDRIGRSPVVAAVVRPKYYRLGEKAFQVWFKNMTAKADNPDFAASVGLKTETIQEIVGEIANAARRRNLAWEIAAKLDLVLHIDKADEIRNKSATVAAAMLNGFVATVGYESVPVGKRPVVGEQKQPVFAPRVPTYDASGIGSVPKPFALNYIADWCVALEAVVRDNASTQDGQLQDPAQNAMLGGIIETLSAPV